MTSKCMRLSMTSRCLFSSVKMDPQLKFSDHIAMNTFKARAPCMVYLTNFTTRVPALMKMFFTTYVCPILEHDSIVWSSGATVDISFIEAVQRFIANKIGICEYLPYKQRLEILNLQSLQYRRKMSDIMFLFKICT